MESTFSSSPPYSPFSLCFSFDYASNPLPSWLFRPSFPSSSSSPTANARFFFLHQIPEPDPCSVLRFDGYRHRRSLPPLQGFPWRWRSRDRRRWRRLRAVPMTMTNCSQPFSSYQLFCYE